MSDIKQNKFEIVHCNKCFNETKHIVHAEIPKYKSLQSPYPEVSLGWSHQYFLLECCGCESVTLRRESWFSEWEPFEGPIVTFFPPQVDRQKPGWVNDLPKDVQELMDEIYVALAADSRRLALMGVRTLADMAIFYKIGDPGRFTVKTEILLERGYIGQKDKDILDVVIDAGNAAAHRAYDPTSEDLNHTIDIVEKLVHSFYISEATSSQIKASTPPRPKHKK